jgi:hypothetical protein
MLQHVEDMAARHANAENVARRQMNQIATWVGEQWSAEEKLLMKD